MKKNELYAYLTDFLSILYLKKDLLTKINSIILFGSVARGDFDKKSDVDILFINKNKKLVGKSCREISLIAGKELNPLIYTREKFNSDLGKNEPLLDSIVNNLKNRVVVK